MSHETSEKQQNQKNVCMGMKDVGTSFEELAHTLVEAGKSEICWVGQQNEEMQGIADVTVKSEGRLEAECPRPQDFSLSFKAFNSWVKPPA